MNLEGNIGNLHERLRGKQYRHQPFKRVHIPKAAQAFSIFAKWRLAV
jgi:hypothetical protein